MAENKLTVEFEVVDKLSKQVDAMSNSVKRLEDQVTKSSSVSSRALASFFGNISSDFAVKALDFLGETAKKAFDVFVVDGVKSASEYEAALTRLNQALAGSGGYTEEAASSFEKFAAKIQASTKFSDQAVLSAGALLTTMTGLTGEGLEKATQAAIDLSAATGKDLDAAITAVGKAINGSSEGLGKLGFRFNEAADRGQNLQNVLGALSRVSGSAEAQAQTYSGATTILGNAFEDLQKTFGQVVTGNKVLIATFNAISGVFVDATKGVEHQQEALRELVGKGILAAIDAFGYLVIAIDGVYRTGVIAFEALKGAAAAFGLGLLVIFDGPIALISKLLSLVPGLGKAFGGVAEEFAQLAGSLADTVNQSAKKIDDSFATPTKGAQLLTDSVLKVRDAAQQAFDDAEKNGFKAEQSFKNAAGGAKTLSEAQQKLIDQGVQLANQLVGQDPNAKYAADVKALQAAYEAKKIFDVEYDIARRQLDDNFQKSKDEQRASEIEKLLAYNENLIAIDEEKNQALIETNRAAIDNIIAQEGISADARIKLQKKVQDADEAVSKRRAENMRSTLGTIATLQQNASGEFFRVGQAAAVATATIDGISAVQKALASAPPPFNFALAALVGVATAANINKIASAQPPKFAKGIDSIPAGYPNDTFPAMLSSGERIVPAKSNTDLTNYLASRAGESDLLASIDAKLSRLSNQIVVNIGGKEIVNEIRDSLQSGRSFA